MTVSHFVSRAAILAALAGMLVVPAIAAVPGDDVILINVDKNGVILDGYDPVAFFTDHKPVKGTAALQSTYRGAIYYFASADHKAAFDLEPAKYEPQFGAFCAYAVSVGRTAPIDVGTFSIINGRLVVQHNAKALGLWDKDPQLNLKRADTYWPAVAKSGGKQIKVNE